MTPQLASLIKQFASNPEAVLAPSKSAAREDVNSNYSGVGDALRQQFMTGGGGGGNGKYGKAVLQSDLARRSDLSKSDVNFDQQAAALPLTAAQMMQQFLGLDFGSSTSSNTNATSTGGTQSTQQTNQTDTGDVSTTGGSSSERQVDQTSKTNKKGGFGFSAGV